MEETLNLEDIIQVIKENIVLIIGATVAFGVAAAFVTLFLMTPQYEARTQVIVSQSADTANFTNQDIQTSLQLINTYREIITSPTILDQVIENLEINETAGSLKAKTTVNNQSQSQVVNITVTDTNPYRGQAIANEIAKVFQDDIPEIMNVDNVSILTVADVGDNPSPVSPQPLINTAIGIILGGLLGLGIAFLRAFLDRRIRNEEDVEKHLGLPVMGTVSQFKQKGRK